MTIYEIVWSARHLKLAPVRLQVRASDSAVRDAVDALLEYKPSAKHRSTLWHGICRPGPAFDSIRITKRRLIVELKKFGPTDTGHGVCCFDPLGWAAQRQQIAWTVRAATGSTKPVKVMVGDYVAIPKTRALNRHLLQRP